VYKLKNFGQFFAVKVRGRLICRSENVPSAITAVVSLLRCINSRRLVGVSGLALVCVIWYKLSHRDKVIGPTLRERVEVVVLFHALIVIHSLSQCHHSLLGQQHPVLSSGPSHELSRSSLAASYTLQTVCWWCDRVGDPPKCGSWIPDVFSASKSGYMQIVLYTGIYMLLLLQPWRPMPTFIVVLRATK